MSPRLQGGGAASGPGPVTGTVPGGGIDVPGAFGGAALAVVAATPPVATGDAGGGGRARNDQKPAKAFKVAGSAPGPPPGGGAGPPLPGQAEGPGGAEGPPGGAAGPPSGGIATTKAMNTTQRRSSGMAGLERRFGFEREVLNGCS